MSEWREIELGDVIETNKSSINREYPHSEILYLDTGSIICNRVNGLQQFELANAPSRAKRLVKDLDIIYSSVRPNQLHYGIIRNPEDNLVVSTGFVVITCKQDEIAPYFLYHYLSQNSTTEFLHSIAEGSTSAYPSLKPSDIEALEILIPPLDEQKSIAEVLSSLDDKIELLHRQNQTLEQMAETLFRQWFVENPNPEWEERPLSSIATYLNGLACQKYPPKNDVDKLPVLKIKELRNGLSEDCDWCTTEVDEKYIVENGDVIFSWSASLMVKIWDGETCILNQHLFKVTSDEFPKWYFYLWSKFHLNQFIAIARAHATTMGHIKRGDLDEAMVLTPSEDEINEMSAHFEPVIEKITVNNRQISKLVALRDTLLPKLMSGEVKVSEL